MSIETGGPISEDKNALATKALTWFRDNGIVFKGEGGQWECVAFKLYSMMIDPDYPVRDPADAMIKERNKG